MKYLLVIVVIFALASICKISTAQTTVSTKDASRHMGEKINVCGKVSGSKSANENAAKSTIIKLSSQGAAPLHVVIRQDDRKNFSYKPEEYLYNKNVCVSGTVTDNNGKTEVIVRKPEEIIIEESGAGAEIRPLEFDSFNRFMQGDI
jgi:hypothetical protein